MANAKMPSAMVKTMTNFIASRRNFTLAQVDALALTTPLTEPTDAEIQTFYDANSGDFTLAESKQLTYVLMTPEMVLDQVEIDYSKWIYIVLYSQDQVCL